MKNLLILLILVAVTVVGCKTKQIPPKPQPVAQPAAQTASSATQKAGKPANISSKEERFSTAQGETADYGSNKYFVIMGSFSVLENAKRLKETLTAENFKPVILKNETGMFRVCGNSYADESEARARIAEVRTNFPKYSDIWLLIKKQ